MAIDLDDFIKKSIDINDVETLFEHYQTALKEYKFDHTVFNFFPPKTDAGETVPTCPYYNISTKLVEKYIHQKLYMIGPIFEMVKTTGRPIIWGDFLNDEKMFSVSPNLAEFIDMIKAEGLYDGMTVPVFGHGSSYGHFSFARTKDDIDLTEFEITTLYHICTNIFRQYGRIIDLDKTHIKAPLLTKREKEVLSWVLKEKSNSVIADIMDLSEHTVATYIKRSAKKLGASSKWGTAITAVLMGYIQY